MHHLPLPHDARVARPTRAKPRSSPALIPPNPLGRLATALLLAASATAALAAEPARTGDVSKGLQWDFPVQTAAIGAPFPEKNIANKGVAIRLADDAAVCFDTDLLRFAAGWTGGWINTRGVSFDGAHGAHPQIVGTQRFGTRPGPGWADARGDFADPRRPGPFGPLPETHARWDGLHVAGSNVVLRYTVLGTRVTEHPTAVRAGGEIAFVRTVQISPAKQDLALVVCDVPGARGEIAAGTARFTSESRTNLTLVTLGGAPSGVRLDLVAGNRAVVRIPAGTPAALFKISLWSGDPARADGFADLAAGAPRLIDFEKGGPAHWPAPVVTRGVLGQSDGPYVLDRLTPPTDNPWKRRVRLGGFDFFADGRRAALSTWDGDVWIVSGIDAGLERLEWRRFASGGFETLGLKIVNEVIYTSGRDQITRYHDRNGDGEADFYENFNNQVTSSQGFHEFQFDLHTDDAGNFYTAKAGPVRAGGSGFGGGGGNGEVTAMAGTVQKISPDGKRREIYATGFRAPTGIGVSPDGQVTTGDNEGTWVPVCPINWVKPGSFHGVEDLAHRSPVPEFKPPLCWIAKSYDNSGGGQVWVTSDKWGPFQGELLHASYGQCALYLVMKESVGDLMQGGIVRLCGGPDARQLMGSEIEIKDSGGQRTTNRSAVRFTSSAMRLRFNPRDGQLYNVGLNGWQSSAAKLAGFDRIRYTGKPVHSVRGLQVTPTGLAFTFTQPLAPDAADPQNISGERWNYRRTKNYGSPEFSVANPEKRGHDKLDITSATLSADGRTLHVAVADLRPADQMLIKFQLQARDGTPIQQTLLHTIHQVPNEAGSGAR